MSPSDPTAKNSGANLVEEGEMFLAGFNEALFTMDAGILRYGEKGELLYASPKAREFLPDMDDPKTGLGTTKLFFAFVCDHSLEWSDQAALSVQWGPSGGFQELISLPGGKALLVRVLRQNGNKTTVVLSDISLVYQRTQAVRNLTEQNKLLMEAVESAPSGIIIASAQSDDFPILFINTPVSFLFGKRGLPLLGGSLRAELMDIFPDQGSLIAEKLDKRESMTLWKFVEQGHTLSWYELQIFPLFRNGKIIHMIGFLSDQTEAKIREEQMAQSHKLEAIGQLAGGVAHDFNNILSIIEGYARMGISAHKRGQPIEEMLQKILQAAKRGSGLTRQLLTFGKRKITEEETISLNAELEDMEVLLRPLLGASHRLVTQKSDRELWVRGTHDAIVQIVMNLAINARDAMPKGGDIFLSASESGEGKNITLSIRDQGTGMDETTMKKIFDPFFTTKGQGKGTGLGLSTVYGLVKQMKGEITVQSEPGVGTTFSIVLPLAEGLQKDERKKEDDGKEEKNVLAGKTALVAEDEPELLYIMTSTLEEFGMNVLPARDGNEALVIQDSYEGPIDFLLTDMVMPELGGLKLAELMTEVRPETAIVFMSGYPVRGDQMDVDLPEDAIFLAKPVSPEKLKQVLESLSTGQKVSREQLPRWQ